MQWRQCCVSFRNVGKTTTKRGGVFCRVFILFLASNFCYPFRFYTHLDHCDTTITMLLGLSWVIGPIQIIGFGPIHIIGLGPFPFLLSTQCTHPVSAIPNSTPRHHNLFNVGDDAISDVLLLLLGYIYAHLMYLLHHFHTFFLCSCNCRDSKCEACLLL